MARIVEEKITVVLSRITSNKHDDLGPVLDEDQLETLKQAFEGLIDDSSVVVEIEKM